MIGEDELHRKEGKSWRFNKLEKIGRSYAFNPSNSEEGRFRLKTTKQEFSNYLQALNIQPMFQKRFGKK